MCYFFQSDACQLMLDPNTANKHLILSERNRTVTCSQTVQSYPDHPDRFEIVYQVLCRESVRGRCYWEVEWSGFAGVEITLSYKSISRKGMGKECEFGNSSQSWSLYCSPSRCSFWHNEKQSKISKRHSPTRIGVYVDYTAGSLSYYSISDTMKLLHRVQTTFTQPLCPGFYVFSGSTVKLLPLTI